jgi:hypothetical protein
MGLKSLSYFNWKSLSYFNWKSLSYFNWKSLSYFNWKSLSYFNWKSLSYFNFQNCFLFRSRKIKAASWLAEPIPRGWFNFTAQFFLLLFGTSNFKKLLSSQFLQPYHQVEPRWTDIKVGRRSSCHLGSMLWSLFLAVWDNFAPKSGNFLEKPMLL